jgi:hypothetical protein
MVNAVRMIFINIKTIMKACLRGCKFMGKNWQEIHKHWSPPPPSMMIPQNSDSPPASKL